MRTAAYGRLTEQVTTAFSYVIFAITASSCLKRKVAKQAEAGRRERERKKVSQVKKGRRKKRKKKKKHET